MPAYTRGEAREWARERLVGAVDCTIPSFSNDLRTLNERAIRHDVRLAREHGFLGTLTVSEVAIDLEEYLEFMRIARDEAGDDLVIVHHASWSDLEQNLGAVRGAEDAGAELVLLSCPPSSTPRPSRRSTTTPARCATRPTWRSSCSRCSCGASARASTPPTSRCA
ncbi:hypothetical protein [Nocardioides flavescens]|uniref:hypothetical protein n=1 Tax=Nocardioides flavescens TaxID=2691959 RepID=UPI001F3D0360|nr:hypothetical protein [Nocardioides flavescens]